MKKTLAILLSFALVLSVTAAFGEPVTIKFAAQADPTPATQAVVDAFNASQSDYKVEWVDMLFLSKDPERRAMIEKTFEAIVAEHGQNFLGWRTVPVNPSTLGKTALDCMDGR